MKKIEICFFRHGIAVERDDPSVTSDTERPLTDDGVRKTEAAAAGLKRMDLEFDKILMSPWLRAKQTASILSEVLTLPASQELAELAGDRTPAELIKALALQPGRRMLLVGHEPLLSSTAVELLGGKWKLDLKKSGAVAIEVDALPVPKAGILLWHLTSRQLRWIKKD